MKLAQVTPLSDGHLLYRGLNGISFPETLLQLGKRSLDKKKKDWWKHVRAKVLNKDSSLRFDDDCRGFVEFAFSSASTAKSVALEYAGNLSCKKDKCTSWNEDEKFCEAHRSTLLEIETGQIDRGADLEWVSQFPSENENVLLPLSNFEITKVRRENNLNILRISLNSNLRAQTLEQLRSSRQMTCLGIAQELINEAKQVLLVCLCLWMCNHARYLNLKFEGRIASVESML